MTEAELVRAKDRLHTFAQVEGFAMRGLAAGGGGRQPGA